jgi:hypothetical protein
VGEALQPDPLQQRVDALGMCPRVLPLRLEGQLDVALQRAPGQQVGLLEDHPDLRVRPGDRLAVEHHPPARQAVQAAIAQSRVDLPQPLGPSTQTSSPDATRIE